MACFIILTIKKLMGNNNNYLHHKNKFKTVVWKEKTCLKLTGS
jgi:hypothetical protein